MADRKHVKWDVRQSGGNMQVTRTEVKSSPGRKSIKTSQKVVN